MESESIDRSIINKMKTKGEHIKKFSSQDTITRSKIEPMTCNFFSSLSWRFNVVEKLN
jgi:hypothetical protein